MIKGLTRNQIRWLLSCALSLGISLVFLGWVLLYTYQQPCNERPDLSHLKSALAVSWRLEDPHTEELLQALEQEALTELPVSSGDVLVVSRELDPYIVVFGVWRGGYECFENSLKVLAPQYNLDDVLLVELSSSTAVTDPRWAWFFKGLSDMPVFCPR